MRRMMVGVLILAACAVNTDGTLFAEVDGEAVRFSMSDDAGAPEVLIVGCKVGELVDEVWEISSDELSFPITLGEVPAGASAVVAYAPPPPGASCTARVAVMKGDDVTVSGPGWEAAFDHP